MIQRQLSMCVQEMKSGHSSIQKIRLQKNGAHENFFVKKKPSNHLHGKRGTVFCFCSFHLLNCALLS